MILEDRTCTNNLEEDSIETTASLMYIIMCVRSWRLKSLFFVVAHYIGGVNGSGHLSKAVQYNNEDNNAIHLYLFIHH